MGKSPAFQFYPGDWLSSQNIAIMTPEQEGAYIRLLCYDWMKDGIPNDDKVLAALSRLGEGWFNGGSTVVLACFNQHPTKDGYLTNDRIQKERERQAEWREKSRVGGLKSGASRKSKGGLKLVEPKGNSSSSSSSSNKPPKSPNGELVVLPESLKTPEFEKAWSEWQKHRREIKKPLTPTSAKKQITKLLALGPTEGVRWIETAIRNGWQGLYEPKESKSNETNQRNGFGRIDRNAGTANESAVDGYANLGPMAFPGDNE